MNKDYLKEKKVSPDGILQLAIQVRCVVIEISITPMCVIIC